MTIGQYWWMNWENYDKGRRVKNRLGFETYLNIFLPTDSLLAGESLLQEASSKIPMLMLVSARTMAELYSVMPGTVATNSANS